MTSAFEMVEMIRDGRATAVELVKSALSHIDETDANLKAWVYLDREGSLARAKELDQMRSNGRTIGQLHGVPVGLKDIIDTRDMPTECGSQAFAGRQPNADALLVSRLRAAGAIILGKTATTPFAFMDPAETRNPHNHEYSPGGSSAGSAAAVAAGHVPLAVGTQTNGSVIRPASFCGTFGFKPTAGVISRSGVLRTSQTLDQVGVFARDLVDVALICDVIADFDPNDPASFCRPRPRLMDGVVAEPPVEPNFVWFDMPYANLLSNDAREGLAEVVNALGTKVEKIDATESFSGLVEAQNIIQYYEIARNLTDIRSNQREKLSPQISKLLDHGATITDEAYAQALELRLGAVNYFSSFFNDFDAIIAPAAPGEAPLFSEGITGNPIFSTIWTLCGLPCLTLPLLVSENNLPIGVQIVGAQEEDDRVMRTAAWLLRELKNER